MKTVFVIHDSWADDRIESIFASAEEAEKYREAVDRFNYGRVWVSEMKVRKTFKPEDYIMFDNDDN